MRRRGVAAWAALAVLAAAPGAADGLGERTLLRGFPPFVGRSTAEVASLRGPGLRVFEQPLLTTADVRLRASLVTLSSGRTLLVNPPGATREAVSLLCPPSGAPSDLVVCNNAVDHTLWVGGWRQALPRARVWAVEPEEGGDAALVVEDDAGIPSPALDEEMRAELDAAVLDVQPFFREVVLFHRPSRTLLATDAVWRAKSARFNNVVSSVGWDVIFQLRRRDDGRGGLDRLSYPYPWYVGLTPSARERTARAVRRFVEAVSAFDFVRVVPAHLDVIDDELDGGPGAAKRLFTGAFDYITR
mmetsp:Transcript_11976/g.40501  ORF Transcript_11976/g.40501 Transcript_11976/m.40501 type:complete len:301 (+) Transcript_11976:1-903(+)